MARSDGTTGKSKIKGENSGDSYPSSSYVLLGNRARPSCMFWTFWSPISRLNRYLECLAIDWLEARSSAGGGRCVGGTGIVVEAREAPCGRPYVALFQCNRRRAAGYTQSSLPQVQNVRLHGSNTGSYARPESRGCPIRTHGRSCPSVRIFCMLENDDAAQFQG